MNILLFQDIKGIGKKGEIKNVADGYALNALLPKKLGAIATPQVIKKYELEKKQEEATTMIQRELAEKTFADLASKTLVIKANSSDKGHLFASIHASDIMTAVRDQYHVVLNTQWMELKHPIKERGTYNIKLHAYGVAGVLNLLIQ